MDSDQLTRVWVIGIIAITVIAVVAINLIVSSIDKRNAQDHESYMRGLDLRFEQPEMQGDRRTYVPPEFIDDGSV